MNSYKCPADETKSKGMRRIRNMKNVFLLAAAGISAGFIIKLFDIYTQNLGNIFSQLSVWFFICTAISVLSSTSRSAVINVFVFCVGMLAAYYITAEMTGSIWSKPFMFGWGIFCLFTPLMSLCVRLVKKNNIASKISAVIFVFVVLSAAYILFDKIRISDILFAVLTCALLVKNHH